MKIFILVIWALPNVLKGLKNSVHWFGISRDIERKVRDCNQCRVSNKTYREPIQLVPVPSKPWETVGTDLYQFKQSKYVVVVDYYSRYIETMLIRDERSITVINSIKSIFARHRIPENVISDNGRQYTSDEFKELSRKYQFKHITSSPKYPRGNSVDERSIQTLKNIMEKSNDPYLGLLSHRTTPYHLESHLENC